jgi:hypothetical protein
VKLSKATTPWARQRLSDADRVLIELAEPRDAEVTLGYSHGWTARITLGRPVVGEAHEEATPRGAFKAACQAMKERVA